MRKVLVLLFVLSLFIWAFAEVKNPDTIVDATIGEPDTLDPHYAYDTASGEVIYNIYENLIDYKGSSLSEFVPRLAEELPIVEEGGKVYKFKIRKGVKFHNGDDLTPEDVEYTFERALIFNPAAGPIWMLFEAFYGVGSLEELVEEYTGKKWSELFDENNEPKPEYKDKLVQFYYDVIDPTIEVEGDYVVFRLRKPYPMFLNIIAQGASWGAILDKEWCISLGLWPQTADNWWKYYDWKKEDSPLYDKTNGTGPFKLEAWDRAQQKVILVRNDNYWREPAKVKKVIIWGIDEWSTRKALLEKGEVDIAYVPTQYINQVKGMEGITVIENLPSLVVVTLNFNWEVKKDSKYIGSGKLDGNGVPPDFFKDKNVRLGFAYAFDYKGFIEKVLHGYGIQVTAALPKGLLGYNENLPKYSFNIAEATKYFKRAYRGRLWRVGFKMTLLYNTGNVIRQTAAEILRDNLAKINPKFKVEVRGVQWPTYLDARKNGLMPAFILGWLADYPDPHNFIYTFYHSRGDYGKYYGKPYKAFAERPQAFFGGKSLDQVIEEAAEELNPEKRQQLYEEIQLFAFDNALGVPIYQPVGIRVHRSWLKGWYYNPIRPGDDYYAYWKEE